LKARLEAQLGIDLPEHGARYVDATHYERLARAHYGLALGFAVDARRGGDVAAAEVFFEG
jgi:hypothetical protein